MSKTYLDGLNDALLIVMNYPRLAGGDGWGEVRDTCDEIAAEIRKFGSVAQMATHSPAKGAAPSKKSVIGSNPIATAKNKQFVFTGTLRRMSRADAHARCVKAGGDFSTSINSATNYLVVGNNGMDTVKYRESKGRGVEILTEDEWYDMTKLD